MVGLFITHDVVVFVSPIASFMSAFHAKKIVRIRSKTLLHVVIYTRFGLLGVPSSSGNSVRSVRKSKEV